MRQISGRVQKKYFEAARQETTKWIPNQSAFAETHSDDSRRKRLGEDPGADDEMKVLQIAPAETPIETDSPDGSRQMVSFAENSANASETPKQALPKKRVLDLPIGSLWLGRHFFLKPTN